MNGKDSAFYISLMHIRAKALHVKLSAGKSICEQMDMQDEPEEHDCLAAFGAGPSPLDFH